MRVAMGGSPLRRIKKRSKTKPKFRSRDLIYENQKNEKYYECWYCGFTCLLGREEEGGKNTPARISHTANYDVPYNTKLILRSHWIVTQTDFEGNIPSEDKVYDIDGSGCPLCHSPNWRGKY